MEKLKSPDVKKKCGRAVGCVVFLCILLALFTTVTYLYRDVNSNRTGITEIAAEEDDIDILFIGGSTTYMFWQPLQAYHDCGFTSYNYHSWLPEAYVYTIEDLMKTQNTQLIVVDLNQILNAREDNSRNIRNYTDSLDLFSATRWKFLTEFVQDHTLAEGNSVVSYYFDIIKYHSSTTALSSEENWRLADNRGSSSYKGYEVFSSENGWYTYLIEPDWDWTADTELDERCSEILTDLIACSRKYDVELLFLASTSFRSGENIGAILAMESLLDEYEIPYLNLWESLDEIGVDFSTDYADANHTNYYGASKVTAFLEEYLMENYDLPDHRDDASYDDWSASYETFTTDMQEVSAGIEEKIAARAEVLEMEETLCEVTDLDEWTLCASNDYFAKLVVWQGDTISTTEELNAVLDALGITISAGEVQMISGKYYTDSSEYTETAYDAVLHDGGYHGSVEISMTAGENSSIVIDGQEYSSGIDGINIVLYDNNKGEVVDAVTIVTGDDGELKLVR